MAYEFYDMAQTVNSTSVASSYRDDLQAVVTDQFDNASDYYPVERRNRTTKVWETIYVRITQPYEIKQQSTIKDDHRTLLFKNQTEVLNMGDLYRFNNYVWMCMDTGRIETPTSSCLIQRCNVELKFANNNSAVVPSTPVFNTVYGVLSLGKDLNMPIEDRLATTSNDEVKVYIPNDADSRLIKMSPNGGTKFLLGNPCRAYSCVSMDTLTFVRKDTTGADVNGFIELKLSNKISNVNTAIDNTTYGLAKQSCY
jgi:hypothetical protein